MPRRSTRRPAYAVPTVIGLWLVMLSTAATADEPVLNQLSALEVRETDKATEIRIGGTTPPTFTVFKLTDPIRLFVDVSNADISALGKDVAVGNGVVDSVGTTQFNDDLVNIGRIEIELAVDAPYTVVAQGNAIVVKIDASQRAEKRPVAAAATGDPDARLRAAETRAATAEARARSAEQALTDARAAEQRADRAASDAKAAETRAQQAEARARDAEQTAARARTDAQGATVEIRTAAAGRATEAERRAAEAEARARDAEARAGEAEKAAAEARTQARAAAVAAESRAEDAETRARAAAEQARARADEAEARARDAEGRATEAEGAAAQARAQADAAGDARALAQAAEARAQAAEARAQAAEADRARLAGQLAALQAEKNAAAQEIDRLEGDRDALARDLEAARAANNAERTRALEAEQIAREARINAERAEVARIESAEAKSKLDEQVRRLQANVDDARADARDADAVRINKELMAARSEADALRSTLEARERALAEARTIAERSRTEADRLESQLAAAEETSRTEAARAEAERQKRAEAEQARLAADESARAARAQEAQAAAKAREAEAARVAQARDVEAARVAQARDAEARDAQARDAQARDAQARDAEAARVAQAREAETREAQAREAQAREAEAARLAQARAADKPAAATTRTRITAVRFADADDRTRVRVEFSGTPDYTLRREGERTRILEFNAALIEPALERSLDTSEFGGPVQLVSSFQAPPPGDRVRIVVTLARPVDDDIALDGQALVWSFARARAPVPMAAAPAYAAPAYATPAREVPYEQTRAAVFTGQAQAIGINDSARPRPAQRKRYSGRKINVDIKDGDLHNILRLLAKEGNVNIVTSDDVEGTITMHLKLVPWDQALDIILRTKGLDMVREGDIIRVAPAEVIAKERENELKKLEVKEKLKPLEVKLITVNHANAAQLLPRVKSVLSARGTVEHDARTNTVIIKDVDDHLDAAEDLIRRLDTQTPQVLIEARIVEVNDVNELELGIQWGLDAIFSAATGNPTGLRFPSSIGIGGGSDDPQGSSQGNSANPNYVVNLPAAAGLGSGGSIGVTLGSVDSTFNLNLRLSALENRGTVKIISSPKIATLDNKQAEISQGVSIPIAQVSANGVQTVFFDAVLKLLVTPHVTQDGNIYLELETENNTPDFQNVGARGDPTILKKTAKTELLLRDGDTTVIGGIYTSQAGYNRNEVPYLSQIPILGMLFRRYRESDRRTELLIFVTPRIINRAASTVQTAP